MVVLKPLEDPENSVTGKQVTERPVTKPTVDPVLPGSPRGSKFLDVQALNKTLNPENITGGSLAAGVESNPALRTVTEKNGLTAQNGGLELTARLFNMFSTSEFETNISDSEKVLSGQPYSTPTGETLVKAALLAGLFVQAVSAKEEPSDESSRSTIEDLLKGNDNSVVAGVLTGIVAGVERSAEEQRREVENVKRQAAAMVAELPPAALAEVMMGVTSETSPEAVRAKIKDVLANLEAEKQAAESGGIASPEP